MRKQVRRRHEAHVRAQSVCAEHSAFFDATPGGQKAHADLDKQVAEVGRLLALQHRSILEGRAATEQCRLFAPSPPQCRQGRHQSRQSREARRRRDGEHAASRPHER